MPFQEALHASLLRNGEIDPFLYTGAPEHGKNPQKHPPVYKEMPLESNRFNAAGIWLLIKNQKKH